MKKVLAVLILGLVLLIPVTAAIDLDGDGGNTWLRSYGTNKKIVKL